MGTVINQLKIFPNIACPKKLKTVCPLSTYAGMQARFMPQMYKCRAFKVLRVRRNGIRHLKHIWLEVGALTALILDCVFSQPMLIGCLGSNHDFAAY